MKSNYLRVLRRLVVHAVLLLAGAGLCMSCSDEQSDVDQYGRDGEGNLTGESKFLGEIEKVKAQYKTAAPPAEAQMLSWDFSNKEVHGYSYELDVLSKMQSDLLDGKLNDIEQGLFCKGILLIKSQGDRTAKVVLKDLQLSQGLAGKPKEELTSGPGDLDPYVFEGMKEDGSGPFGSLNLTMFLTTMCPLPVKVMKIGESVDIPTQIPCRVMGVMLQIKGRCRLTLRRYVMIGDRLCAELDIDTNISKVTIPPELPGEYQFAMKGVSVCYYDPVSRSVVSATEAILMKIYSDSPVPNFGPPGKKKSKNSKTSSASDHIIRLKSIEQWSAAKDPEYQRDATYLQVPRASTNSEFARLISGHPNITDLNMDGCTMITDLRPISRLTDLTKLHLGVCENVADLSPLAGLTKLTYLDFSFCHKVRDLSPLASLTELDELNLDYCEKVTDLSPLTEMKKLTTLSLPPSTTQEQLAVVIADHPGLTSLSIRDCNGITDLAPVASLKQLTWLCFPGRHETKDLSALRKLVRLRNLILGNMPKVNDLTPLAELKQLKRLVLSTSDNMSKEDIRKIRELIPADCVWRPF